jgi:hypothetical protein
MLEETLYEWLERTRLVDSLLLVFALAGPLTVAALAWAFQSKPFVLNHRANWVLALLSCPTVFLLWRGYNAITNHFGLETLKASFLSLMMFAATTAALAGLARMLDTTLKPPSIPPGASSGSSTNASSSSANSPQTGS